MKLTTSVLNVMKCINFENKNIMTNLHLYNKISELPDHLKSEVSDFIDFLRYKSSKKSYKNKRRIPGKARGLIKMKNNFDDPIDGFKEYIE